VIKQDKLGLDNVYVQAKRWEGSVGGHPLRDFAGSLEAHKASKGVFVTTSKFSPEALDFVMRIGKNIVLVDGTRLADLMIDYGVGVTQVRNYSVKKADPSYFGLEE
jgi:restriction system protein